MGKWSSVKRFRAVSNVHFDSSVAKMKGSVSKEELIGSATSPIGGGSQTSLLSIKDAPESIMGPPIESILKDAEKKFLLIVERGDVNGVKKYAPIVRVTFS